MTAVMGVHNYLYAKYYSFLIFLVRLKKILLDKKQDIAPLFFRDNFACSFIGYASNGDAPIIE